MNTSKQCLFLLTAFAAVSSVCPAQTAKSTAQEVNKAAPSFQASGIAGDTAPSGYSAGVSEDQNHQVLSVIAQLQKESVKELLLSFSAIPCSGQSSIRSAALDEPESFEANNNLGRFYLQHGDPQLGTRYLQIAAEIRPHDHENILELAVGELDTQQYANASHTLESLIQKNDADAVAHSLLGIADAATGKRSEALAELRRSVALDTGDKIAFAVGLTLLRDGSLADAERLFAGAINLHPGSANLWLGLGMAESLRGMKSQASYSLLRASSLNPSGLLAYTLLAGQAGEEPSTDVEIATRLHELTKDKPTLAIAHYAYALALFKANEGSSHELPSQQIESELKLAIKEQPQLAAAHYQLGRFYAQSGANAPAIVELATANELEPGVAEWHYRLARVYRQNQQIAISDQQMQMFKNLKTRRAAGEDVSANLLEGLSPQAIGSQSTTCEAVVPR